MLQALTGLSRAHQICYLDIRYLVIHSSSNIFHLSKITKIAKNVKVRPPLQKLKM